MNQSLLRIRDQAKAGLLVEVLYNGDKIVNNQAKNLGFYFDPCRKTWSIKSDWEHINNLIANWNGIAQLETSGWDLAIIENSARVATQALATGWTNRISTERDGVDIIEGWQQQHTLIGPFNPQNKIDTGILMNSVRRATIIILTQGWEKQEEAQELGILTGYGRHFYKELWLAKKTGTPNNIAEDLASVTIEGEDIISTVTTLIKKQEETNSITKEILASLK